jgi:hypothetical protein
MISESPAALIPRGGEPAFPETLEMISCVPNLLPDLHLDGEGLHASGFSGVLAPHTDFHLHQRLDLYRVLNVLIYLSRDWGEADGGELERYAEGEATPAVRVAPTFGRSVIFKTDEMSAYGFIRPVAQGKWRRSAALYYYTIREQSVFNVGTSNGWVALGSQKHDVRLSILYRIIRTARLFSNALLLGRPQYPSAQRPPVSGRKVSAIVTYRRLDGQGLGRRKILTVSVLAVPSAQRR